MAKSRSFILNDFYDFPASREWTAQWIGPPVQERGADRFLFRKEFTLAKKEGTTLFISAGREYELFVNGKRITNGPPPSQPYWKYYDEIDVSGYLKTGNNCIAIVVWAIGEPCGLIAELVSAKGKTILVTDEEWRVTGHHGWRVDDKRAGLCNSWRQEILDARIHPKGWERAGFDALKWSNAEFIPSGGSVSGSKPPISFPWYRMIPRGIPLLRESAVRPTAIVKIEEGQEIYSRFRGESLSVQLSAAGRPVRESVAGNTRSLLSKSGKATFQCSLGHQKDKAFDGIWCPNVVLDFGKVHSGHLEIDLDGPEGVVVEIGYVERLLNGHFNNAVEVPYADRYTLRKGRQTYRCAIWKSFRFVKIRFLRCFTPVTVRNVRTIACGYPFKTNGAFRSKDDTLNKVFDLSRRTLRLCCRDHIVDSPWREKNQWIGDIAAVVLGGIYACFGDTDLAGKTLRQAAANQLPNGLLANICHDFSGPGPQFEEYYHKVIPDYSLWWIHGLWNHYLYSGEEAIIHECYPVLVQILQFHFQYLNRSGLVANLPTWVFIDHVFNCRAPELAVYNALFYGTLEIAQRIANVKDDAWFVDKIGEVRTAISANFHKRFYNSARGVYVDGYANEKQVSSVSEHANMAAILWGLCPSEQQSTIIDKFYVGKQVKYLEAQPFFTSVVLRALARAGRMDVALELIRERWGKRMAEQGMTSATEEWNASGSWRGKDGDYVGIFRSLSHAWSAFPAEFLIKYLMGLEIMEPGCKKVSVNPMKAQFDYSVKFPTPKGSIAATYERGQLKAKVPKAIECNAL